MFGKRKFWLISIVVAIILAFSACGKTEVSVSLDVSTLSLQVGESRTLIATVKPDDLKDKDVTWTSSEPSVASVLNGTVRALKAGTTIITVTTNEGKKTASCVVTVTDVEVESITISKTAAALKAKQQVILTATANPENATNRQITWSSSDEDKAIVVDGVVTTLAKGTVTITATAANGVSASCNITITDPDDYNGYIAINSIQDYENFLSNAASNANKKFYLTQDLDFEGREVRAFGTKDVQLVPDQSADAQVISFRGVFDGMGHKIKNAKFVSGIITADSGENLLDSNGQLFVAMFSKLNGGTVRNIAFENCVFHGHLWVSAVAGQAEAGSLIENIYINGDFSTQHPWYDTWCWSGTVTSINRGTIRNVVVNSTLYSEGYNYTKGVVGASVNTTEIVYVINTGAWAAMDQLYFVEGDPGRGLTPKELVLAEVVMPDDAIVASTFKYLNINYWNLEDGKLPELKVITP